MNVRDVMTPAPATVGPDAPLKDVAQLLMERRISGVPVVDEAGAVLGVISEGDFLLKEAQGAEQHRTLWARLWGRQEHEDLEVATCARDLMTSPAVTIEAGMSLSSAAALMASRKINRLPVVEGGRLVGILTRADVVRSFVRSDEELLADVGEAIRALPGVGVTGVRDGVAVLTGVVADPEMAASLREAVHAIDGILAIDDSGITWPEPREVSETAAWRAREDFRDDYQA